MKYQTSNRYLIIIAVAVTALSACCNLDIMIEPNPIGLWNAALSAATCILWMITIVSIVKKSDFPLKKAIHIAVVLAATILANHFVFIWEDLNLQQPLLAEEFALFTFLPITPFVGLNRYLEQVNMSDTLKFILLYLLLLGADVTPLISRKGIKR